MPAEVSADSTGSVAPVPRDLTPVVADLAAARSSEEIFALLLRATRAHTAYAALLSVHSDRVHGRRAIADDGFDATRIAELEIPRDAVPAFEQAVSSGQPYVGPIASTSPGAS